MIPKYYGELVKIRRILEIVEPNFPQCNCDVAAAFTYLILGLEAVGGKHIPSGRGHSWNHDINLGLFVDLTQDQFGGIEEKVVILPDTSDILRANQEFSKGYSGRLALRYHIKLRPAFDIYFSQVMHDE